MTPTATRIRKRFCRLAESALKRFPRRTHEGLNPDELSWEIQGVDISREFPPILGVIMRQRGIDTTYRIAEMIPNHIMPPPIHVHYNSQIVDAYHQFAMFFIESGHFEHAEKLQRNHKIEKHHPSDMVASLIKAREYDKALRVSATIPIVENDGYIHISLEERIFPNYIKIAKARLKSGDFRGARRVFNRFKKLIRQNPRYANLFRFHLARAYYRLGWIKQSAKLLEDILIHITTTKLHYITGPSQFCTMAYAIARAGYWNLGLRMMKVAYYAFRSEIIMVGHHLPHYLFLLNRFNMHNEAKAVLAQMLAMKNEADTPKQRVQWLCFIGTGTSLNPHHQAEYGEIIREFPTAMAKMREDRKFPDEFVMSGLLYSWLHLGEFDAIIDLLGQLYWQMFDVAFFLPHLLKMLRVTGQSERGRTVLRQAQADLKLWKSYEQDISYALIEPALMSGFVDEAIEFSKDIKSRYQYGDIYCDISRVLLRQKRYKDFLKLRYIGDVHELISIISQLAPELDAIQDGLAFDILSDCITIAARTHPEWGVVAAMIQNDNREPS